MANIYTEGPMADLVELVAKAIVGPANINGAVNPQKLAELRDIRWNQLSTQDQNGYRGQAQSVVFMLDAYSGRDETYWDGVVRRIQYDMGIS